MKILTWDTPNFGDRLNEHVWSHYLGERLCETDQELLVGIGSLLNHRLPVGATKYILGAGVGHGDAPTLDESWKISWVRGPRSAQFLGLPAEAAITDGAMLLADLVDPPQAKRYPVSFIPHCSAVGPGSLEVLQALCAEAGIHFINPESPVPRVLDEIGASQRVIAEALHGAITADALRIPWHPVTRRGVFSFKWQDWTESMELRYDPTLLMYRPQWFAEDAHERLSRRLVFPLLAPASRLALGRQLRRIARGDDWRLSDPAVLADRVARMKRALARIV